MAYLVSVILIVQSLLVLLILSKWIEAREDRNEKQRIIEGQEEALLMRNARIKLQDEVIARQREVLEEKLTEKVKEAFEKPKRPRGRLRKNA